MTLRTYRFLVLLIVIIPFLATILAVYLLWKTYVFPLDIVLLLSGVLLTGLGVTIGFHRMCTHEGFHAPDWLRGLFLILGCMAFEGGPMGWTGRHIQHHAHSDEEGDPHSPLDGFWHAHIGWMLKRDDVFLVQEYAPQLKDDPVVVFVDKYAYVWMALSVIIPGLIGGWTGLLWGGIVRVFIATHVTWSVNSICHTFGKRDFDTTDESRNNLAVAILGFGEGWHNNHHAFPRNAFHGMQWWQFDLSGIVIRLLEATGLIWDVQRVAPETAEAHKIRSATMQEQLRELRMQLGQKIQNAKIQFMSMVEFRGTPHVTPEDIDIMAQSCESSLRRLNQIQAKVSRATHLKKQKLISYMGEVQRLCDEAKAQATSMVALQPN
jgi:stearoyl-CoA desaturase (delta-9 desaturase)